MDQQPLAYRQYDSWLEKSKKDCIDDLCQSICKNIIPNNSINVDLNNLSTTKKNVMKIPTYLLWDNF